MIVRVGYVALDVTDLEETIRFYTAGVGIRVVEQSSGVTYMSSNDRHHELILRKSQDGIDGFRYLGLEVAPGTLGASVEQAVKAGATTTDESNQYGVDGSVLIDTPVGFRIELFEGMHKVEAPAASDGPVRFEHVNVATPEIDAWTTFLADGIGLRISDRAHGPDGGTVLTWMHCPVPGADHHGVAQTLAPVNRLHHIKWEYPDLEQVVERVDRFGDEGTGLVWGMGRHGVDRSIFAYVKDPGGLMNELGIGMLQVDNSPHWSEARDMPIDEPQLTDHWGSQIPQPWLDAGIPISDVDAARA